MSVEQYQRAVNTLDKEIAELEKKKSDAEKKAAEAEKKAVSVSIRKNASAATIKSKLEKIAKYNTDAASEHSKSAALAKKIADKRKKRNDVAIRLQKEEQKVRKRQDSATKQMRQLYERRIEELQTLVIPPVSVSSKTEEEQLPEYDVFVSHAWEDKEDFVDAFVKDLTALNIKVWYDTSQIKWGDSMRERIDDGLKKSRFGVVVLSPSYIAENKYWTKAELDGLFQLESVNGKTLLPIWHKLTKQQVMNYSPIIANKKAMTTASMTAQEIAEELLNLIPKDETEENNNKKNENGV